MAYQIVEFNGKEYEFDKDMSDDEIQSALQSESSAAAPEPTQHGLAASALTGFGDWASYGFLDNAQGHVGALIEKARGVDKRPYGEIQTERTNDARKTSDEMWQQNPGAYGAGATVGAVASPTLGAIKGAAMLGRVAPKLFGTPAKAAALVNAPLSALGAAGDAETTDGLGLKMAGSAVVGMIGGAAGGKIADHLANPFITRWARDKKVDPNTAQELADRFASAKLIEPSITTTAPNANRVAGTAFKSISEEADLLVQKAKVEGRLGPGDDTIANGFLSRLRGKSFVFTAKDLEGMNRIFGPDTEQALKLMRQSETLSEHFGSMKELVGTVTNALETRTSPGNMFDATNMGSLGILKSLNRSILQPRNTVNKLAKVGNPENAGDLEKIRLSLVDAVARKTAGEEAASPLGRFDPASQSVIDSASYGNPDFLKNSVPPPADYFPTSGITDDARKALAKVEAMRRLADPKGKTVATAEGGDLPTMDLDPSSVGKTLPKPKAIRPYKIAAENLDTPALLSGYGARGALANTLFQDTGIHATNRQVNTALKSAVRIVKAKTDPAEWAIKRETLKDPTNLDPELYDQAAQSLMKLAGAKQKMGIGSPGNVNGWNETVYDKKAWEAGKELIESMRLSGADVVRLPEGGLRVSVVGGPEIGVVKNAAAARSLWEKYLASQPPK